MHVSMLRHIKICLHNQSINAKTATSRQLDNRVQLLKILILHLYVVILMQKSIKIYNSTNRLNK